jgi:hypothetical protein
MKLYLLLVSISAIIFSSASKSIRGPAVDVECGDCYGAKSEEFPCCNTCKDVIDAYYEAGEWSCKASDFAQCVAEYKAGKMGYSDWKWSGCDTDSEPPAM